MDEFKDTTVKDMGDAPPMAGFLIKYIILYLYWF